MISFILKKNWGWDGADYQKGTEFEYHTFWKDEERKNLGAGWYEVGYEESGPIPVPEDLLEEVDVESEE